MQTTATTNYAMEQHNSLRKNQENLNPRTYGKTCHHRHIHS